MRHALVLAFKGILVHDEQIQAGQLSGQLCVGSKEVVFMEKAVVDLRQVIVDFSMQATSSDSIWDCLYANFLQCTLLGRDVHRPLLCGRVEQTSTIRRTHTMYAQVKT